MSDATFLSWPFFAGRHRALAEVLGRWCSANLPVDHDDVDAAWLNLVRRLGEDGWLVHSAPDPDTPSPLAEQTLPGA